MRIFNGTKSVISLPLTETQRITIAPRSVSGDIMPSSNFLSLLVGSYDYGEIALIVSGPYEINMCSQVSGCAGFVVQSLDEAIERFMPKKEEPKVETKKEEDKKVDVITTTAAPKEEKKAAPQSIAKEKVSKDSVVIKKEEN